ncbi:hypothetical protein SVIOM74S_03384 [Streptomyces violarus]
MGLAGLSVAAGLTVSLAPMTRTTEVAAKSSLISSISRTMSYGTFASASSTFMCPGSQAGDGVDAEAHLDAPLAQLARQLGDRVLGLGDGHAVAGRDDHRGGVAQEFRGLLGADLAVLALLALVGRRGRVPKPPAITEMKDRFIALHMMYDR